MRRVGLLVAVAALFSAGAALAQNVPQPEPVPRSTPVPVTGAKAHPAGGGPKSGAQLYQEKCVMCHDANGMGTGLLARRMDPAVAELTKRRDLTADYVIQAARTGIGNMPPIPRGEASDAELAAIAGYLAKGTAQ